MYFFGNQISMVLIWLIVAIACGLIEFLALGFSLGFLGGACAALLVSLVTENITIQIGAFIIVTLIFIIYSRSIIEKHLKTGSEKTGIEAIVGKEAVVTTPILPHKTGIVRVDSMDWTAISSDRVTPIEEGTLVKVIDIEGVKLLVKKLG